jgi:hypothetical protein
MVHAHRHMRPTTSTNMRAARYLQRLPEMITMTVFEPLCLKQQLFILFNLNLSAHTSTTFNLGLAVIIDPRPKILYNIILLFLSGRCSPRGGGAGCGSSVLGSLFLLLPKLLKQALHVLFR